MIEMINQVKKYLFEPKSVASLGLFRVLVGCVLFLQTAYWIATDFVAKNIIEPPIKFPFPYFEFVKPLSQSGMGLLMYTMLFSCFLIIIGKAFRVACAVFFFTFTYFWMIDTGYFNNHYYFISLLVFLLFFTDADKWNIFKLKQNQSHITVPNWQIFILRFQVFIIFFIGGLNKLNPYWLFDFQPMKFILETKASVSNMPWLASTFFFAAFSWLGLLFDISIGFLLWIRKTRKFAFITYILFNLTNFLLFYNIGEIGFFPLLLVASLVIFISPEKIDTWLAKKLKPTKVKTKEIAPVPTKNKLVFPAIVLFVVFQFLFPFRHLLIPGQVDYTGQGQRFAWRMKIMYKAHDIQFYFTYDGNTEKTPVKIADLMTDKQYTNLIYYPNCVPVAAKYLKKILIEKGVPNPKVYADFKIGFQGQELQSLFSPDIDLAMINYHPHKKNDWIIPLKD
ncbi:MAG: HTTM domain-containing protein [Chitinophagales bacterium]